MKPIPTKKHETLTLHDWMTLPCFKKPISTVENQDLPTISKARVPPPQLVDAEKGLMDSIEELVKRKQIIGPPPTLEDLVNPIEEQEVGNSPYRFEGGDAEIIAEVRNEMAVARGKVIEVDLDSENEGDAVPS